jgi:hypothetical protein
MLNSIDEIKKTADTMQKELLEAISALSDGTASDRSSSVCMIRFGKSANDM